MKIGTKSIENDGNDLGKIHARQDLITLQDCLFSYPKTNFCGKNYKILSLDNEYTYICKCNGTSWTLCTLCTLYIFSGRSQFLET